MNRNITINGRTYIYLTDNDQSELVTSSDYVGNQYGTTSTDIELNAQAAQLEEDEYVNNYINR